MLLVLSLCLYLSIPFFKKLKIRIKKTFKLENNWSKFKTVKNGWCKKVYPNGPLETSKYSETPQWDLPQTSIREVFVCHSRWEYPGELYPKTTFLPTKSFSSFEKKCLVFLNLVSTQEIQMVLKIVSKDSIRINYYLPQIILPGILKFL